MALRKSRSHPSHAFGGPLLTLFGVYVTYFSTYNQFYGSIGTLLIIQLWIYVNAMGLLIGFELNASMAEAKNRVSSTHLNEN